MNSNSDWDISQDIEQQLLQAENYQSSETQVLQQELVNVDSEKVYYNEDQQEVKRLTEKCIDLEIENKDLRVLNEYNLMIYLIEKDALKKQFEDDLKVNQEQWEGVTAEVNTLQREKQELNLAKIVLEQNLEEQSRIFQIKEEEYKSQQVSQLKKSGQLQKQNSSNKSQSEDDPIRTELQLLKCEFLKKNEGYQQLFGENQNILDEAKNKEKILEDKIKCLEEQLQSQRCNDHSHYELLGQSLNQEMEMRISSLENIIREKDQSLQLQKQDFEACLSQNQNDYRCQLSDLHMENERFKGEIVKLSDERDQQKRENDDLIQLKNNQIAQFFEQERQSYQENEERYLAQVDELTLRNQQQDADIEAQQLKLNQKQNEYQQLQIKENTLENQIKVLEEQLQSQGANNKRQLEEQLEVVEKQVHSNAQQRNSDLQATNEQLKVDLEKKEENMKVLVTKFDSLTDIFQKNEKYIENYKVQINRLEEDIQVIQKQLEDEKSLVAFKQKQVEEIKIECEANIEVWKQQVQQAEHMIKQEQTSHIQNLVKLNTQVICHRAEVEQLKKCLSRSEASQQQVLQFAMQYLAK